jgi:uncharacterized membrane protein YdjX (TVP38/TMEM64 family)
VIDFLRGLSDLGPWGPILFIGAYALSCVLFIPASLLTLGGGAVYGLFPGGLYVLIGANLGSAACFLLGRTYARGWIENRVAGNERFAAVDRAVEREGWKVVALARLSPVIPFSLLNYAFALTRVPLRHYLAASALGMIPGTLLYVYAGALAGSVAGLGAPRRRSPYEWAFWLAGLAATIAAVTVSSRLARRALDEHRPH